MEENKKPQLCYVHFSQSHQEEILHFASEFFEPSAYHVQNTTKAPDVWVYCIELTSIEKSYLEFLLTLAKTHKNALIYLFAPKELHQTLLYKYALHINAKEVLSPSQDGQVMQKFFTKVYTALGAHLRQRELADFALRWQQQIPLIHYARNTPNYASEAAKAFFGSTGLEAIPSFDTFSKEKTFQSLTDKSHQEWSAFCDFATQANETTAVFFPYELTKHHHTTITLKHRFETIEWLKDHVVFSGEGGSQLTLVLVCIHNHAILQKSLSQSDYHAFLKQFLGALTAIKEYDAPLSSWDANTYLLCYENTDTDIIRNHIESLHESLFDKEAELNPILNTSIWSNVHGSLQNVIKILDNIAQNKFEPKDAEELHYTLVASCGEELSESEQILRLFHSFMFNKTPLKLQNIYKGLCINTPSHVMKIKDKLVYFECQTLQAYAASESQDVVVRGEELAYDIHANVKLIDIEDGYIIADSFYFLPDSANNRQYTRVQTSFRNPIYLKQNRIQLQGEILDISLKSVALSCRQTIDKLDKNQPVFLTFKLPDPTLEEGFVEIKGGGTIVYMGAMESLVSKIVVMLNLKEPHDASLLRYMYLRQKELITELKHIAKTVHRH